MKSLVEDCMISQCSDQLKLKKKKMYFCVVYKANLFILKTDLWDYILTIGVNDLSWKDGKDRW